MGCDIHTYLETQKTINGELKWVCADRFKLNPYFCENNPHETKYEIDPIYNNRDYTLFAALAGVRDYGNKVALLAQPRGLPDDVNQIILNENEHWGSCGHSHSWFTLQELYDYQDANSKVIYNGLVSPEAAKALDETGEPPLLWCQGTTNQSYVRREWIIEEDVLKFFIKPIEARARKEHCIYWKDDERVVKEKAEKTRVVFWFDN